MNEELKKRVDTLIKQHENEKDTLKKYIAIKKLISHEAWFLKVDVQIVYSILRDIKIAEEDLQLIYIKLMTEVNL